MLKDFLQGKPFGHPLHPALVHFPIGLFMLSLVLDVLSYLNVGSTNLFRASAYALGMGLAMGLLAGITGLADRSDIRLDHPARRTATIHMALNLTALALFGLNLYLRTRSPDLTAAPVGLLLLTAAGAGIILFSGYLGGTMVYDDGIGAGRHRRRTGTPRQTRKVASGQEKGGWAFVCDEAELGEGETLRVDYQGTILAIARQGEELYAFQEFCTHRFGPLSEGKIQAYQVECPWHRSCFDIRTGKVVEGPAKVDLRTFPVTLRAGKIYIR